MKITNTKTGEAYQLTPGTTLEIERPNLFFNEWGEQSLPVDLPDSDKNRRLCGYPELSAMNKKPSADLECTLEEKGYYSLARQAILSAKRGESISCSFYLNEGSFLSKIQDVTLKTVFGDECVAEVNTVDEGIEFCKKIAQGTDPRFLIFTALVDDGSEYTLTEDSGREQTCTLIYLNRRNNDGGFWNEIARTVKNGDDTIIWPAGCYITPFMRANYLLQRIFAYFGYELQDNFFTKTEPFINMVILNNTCDTLLGGKIRMTDLIPDCTCSTILDVFRKKFLCEFIPDETEKKVYIRLLNELIDETPVVNLDPYIDGNIGIEYPDSYQQIVLSSENALTAGDEIEQLEGPADVLKMYPNAMIHRVTGSFILPGYKIENGKVVECYKTISSASTPFNAEAELENNEVTVPDMIPEFRTLRGKETGEYHFLCVGQSRWKNSVLLANGTGATDTTDGDDISEEGETLTPMLAFCRIYDGGTEGLISDHYTTYNRTIPSGNEKWSDYSLLYNGENGIFEKFYRRYDDILRNSFHQIQADLVLNEKEKLTLSPFHPVSICGQKVLPDIISYSLGGGREPVECTFRTIRNYEPVTTAPDYSTLYDTGRTCEWKGHYESSSCTKEEYEAGANKDNGLGVVYPRELPVESMADGTKYYERTWFSKSTIKDEYRKAYFYLYVVLKQ